MESQLLNAFSYGKGIKWDGENAKKKMVLNRKSIMILIKTEAGSKANLLPSFVLIICSKMLDAVPSIYSLRTEIVQHLKGNYGWILNVNLATNAQIPPGNLKQNDKKINSLFRFWHRW